ncbi:MAG: hypothetical protein KDB21_14490, partial [Acidimicrobiales bacterium]|nr:hypothetical protein [Acidimicrobiales bacterium]
MFTTDVSFPAIDFDRFHTDDLPTRLAAGSGALAAPDLAGVAPLAFELTDGRAVTYVPFEGGVHVEAGVADDAGAVIRLQPGHWSDFVQELRTSFGLLYAGLVEARRGSLEHLIRWEPALRAMFHGRPV